MNFFNRKPKATALRLSEIADLEEKLTGMEAICRELQEQAKRDAAHIEAQGKAIADLHGELAMAHEVEVSQAEVISAQQNTILDYEGDLRQEREEKKRGLETIERLEHEVETLRKSNLSLEKGFEGLERALEDAQAPESALRILSRQAIHLLLFPRGMHQSWKIDREKLLAEYKAIGIEAEA